MWMWMDVGSERKYGTDGWMDGWMGRWVGGWVVDRLVGRGGGNIEMVGRVRYVIE